MPPAAKRGERSASAIQRDREANKGKRAHFVKSIERAHAKVNDADFIGKTLFELEEELTSLSEAWTEYKKEYSKIFDEVLEADESEEAEQVFVATEKIYLSSRSKIRARIAQITPKPDAQPAVVTQQPLTVELKQPDALANIQNSWGYFSGDYAEWPSFRDRYKSRMHDRTDVLVTHKWGHLRASLSGDALRAMGRWQDTDENYIHAWNRLCSQYNDDYMAVQTLVQKLLNIPKMQRATSEGLRNIIDTVHECLSQLEAYVSVNSWDPLIIFLVIDKLDKHTRTDWEKLRHSLSKKSTLTHGSNQNLNQTQNEVDVNVNDDAASQTGEASGGQVTLPTWPQMEDFLDQQAKILRDVTNSSHSTQHAEPQAGPSNANRNQQSQKQHTPKPSHVNDSLPPCLLCRVKHATFNCPTWLSMNMDDRETYQKTNRLCITCVQPNHGNSPCWGKPGWAKRCPACWNAANETIFHNSTLCRRTEAKRMQRTLTLQLGQPPSSNAGKNTPKGK